MRIRAAADAFTNELRARRIRRRELPPRQHGYGKSREERRPHDVEARRDLTAVLHALDAERPHEIAAAEQWDCRGCHAGYAGLSGKLLFYALVDRRRSFQAVAVLPRCDAEAHERVDVDAELDARDVLQASREERGKHEQHHRERDLRREESASGACGARPAERLRSVPLHCGGQVGTRSAQRGEEPAREQRGHAGECSERSRKRTNLGSQRIGEPQRQQSRNGAEQQRRDRHAQDSARCNWCRGLGQELHD